VLVIYPATGGVRGWGSDDGFAGIGLALVIGAMIYLKRLDDKADQEIAQRIKAEYPIEAQPPTETLIPTDTAVPTDTPWVEVLTATP
jgi:hypothetical protein